MEQHKQLAKRGNWGPRCNAQQNFLRYRFPFLLVPTQIHNPKTSYQLFSKKSIVALYYPLIFVRPLYGDQV